MFVDTHLHLYKEYYEDLDLVINESIKTGVTKWINNGCDNKSNIEVISLLDRYEGMYGALGIHPEKVLDYREEDLLYIKNNLDNKKIVAIGEIGLDYYYTKDNKQKQIELFEHQLIIAEDSNLPVIVHSREATKDTIDTIKKYKVTGVIHSFSGSFETAQEYIKMGFLLGINGVITFKNSNLKDVIKKIPLEYIVLETDSPYLTPEPFRGKKNDPSHIIDIAKYICDLKNITLNELSSILLTNINKLYKI